MKITSRTKKAIRIPSPDIVHANAVDKGWYEEPRPFPTDIALMHSELSEALEAYRNRIPEGQKGCMSEELADCIIRILDTCGYHGIKIEKAIWDKHEYNKTRPHRHGGKKC